MVRALTPSEKLQAAITAAFDASIGELSEKEALDAALDVAEGWQMRLDELDDDEGAPQ
jgi:hypothetical protein